MRIELGVMNVVKGVRGIRNFLSPTPVCPKCTGGKEFIHWEWVKDPIYGKIRMWVCHKCGAKFNA